MTHSARSLSQSDRPGGPGRGRTQGLPRFHAFRGSSHADTLLAVINKAAGHGYAGPASHLPPGKGALVSRSRTASGPLQRSLPQSASGKTAIDHQYATPGDCPLTLPGDSAAPADIR
jgi:hypothetical protein